MSERIDRFVERLHRNLDQHEGSIVSDESLSDDYVDLTVDVKPGAPLWRLPLLINVIRDTATGVLGHGLKLHFQLTVEVVDSEAN